MTTLAMELHKDLSEKHEELKEFVRKSCVCLIGDESGGFVNVEMRRDQYDTLMKMAQAKCGASPPYGMFRQGFVCTDAHGHDGPCSCMVKTIRFTWEYPMVEEEELNDEGT